MGVSVSIGSASKYFKINEMETKEKTHTAQEIASCNEKKT
jgi:hypothetical protein